MAAVYGVNITNLDATPRVPASSEQVHGVLRVWYDTYEASSVSAADTITMARMPAYSTVHDVVLKCDALAGSSTLIVGDSDDPNRFIEVSGTWNAAGQTQSMLAGGSNGSAPAVSMNGLAYRYTSETDVYITTGGATINNSIHMWVYYTTD